MVHVTMNDLLEVFYQLYNSVSYEDVIILLHNNRVGFGFLLLDQWPPVTCVVHSRKELPIKVLYCSTN